MAKRVQVPAGVHKIQLPDGTIYLPDKNGLITLNTDTHMSDLLHEGCTELVGSGTTAARPTTAAPGTMYFDSTLGKPVWRNAAGTGWVDSSGTAA